MERELEHEGLVPPRTGEVGSGNDGVVREEAWKAGVIREETIKRIERIGLMVGGYIAEKSVLFSSWSSPRALSVVPSPEGV
jgi:hypothetical protein